jgi:hypothetical protein
VADIVVAPAVPAQAQGLPVPAATAAALDVAPALPLAEG